MKTSSRVLAVLGLAYALRAAALDGGETLPTTEPPTPPPGVPASSPDTAPLPPGTNSPAWDAIRQRCAIAIDQRSCIEAAQRDETRSAPPDTVPPH